MMGNLEKQPRIQQISLVSSINFVGIAPNPKLNSEIRKAISTRFLRRDGVGDHNCSHGYVSLILYFFSFLHELF
ncbi:hypothetical protein NC652_022641 [Populus alba x Populus x berolinensis]|nr:hypothetical protein NC652_022641 [Populus alba x Populus x berolinensis]